jgi:plastocyanin
VANVNDAPTGEVIIAGDAIEDQTLSVSQTLADVDGMGEVSFQWLVNGSAVDGATTSTFALTQQHVGATLSVEARYTDGAGQQETVTSAIVGPVANINDLPVGEVVINGIAEQGEIVTASNSLSDEDGLGIIGYQWQREGNAIAGATLDSYILSADDVGLSITVVAMYIDGQGGPESVVSQAIVPTGIEEPEPTNQPPAITAPADITVNATGLFTEVDLGLAIALDAEDGNLAVTADSNSFFSPGSHTVTWSAVDSEGSEATDTQVVNVIPLVSFSKDQNATEGTTVSFSVILNGPAVTYPVEVPYTVGGTTDSQDHNLQSATVTIEEGQLQTVVTLDINDDALVEGMETIVVTLGTPVNAVPGPKQTHTIRIFEENVAPDVTLEATQREEITRIIGQNDGMVVVDAVVNDPNVNDVHSYDWSRSDNALVDIDSDDNTFTFDPSTLSPGFYKLRVEVSDGDKVGKDRLKIRIEEALPVLNDNEDTDGDGVDDQTEGTGDDDDDGIPDFLDFVGLTPNVIQENPLQQNQFLMETEPGLLLSLGEVAFRANGTNTGVNGNDIQNHGNEGQGAQEDEGYEYSGGLFDFNVEDIPVAGQSVNIVVAQFAPVPSNAVYRKLMPTGWQDFVIDENNAVHSALGAEGFCPPPGDVAYQVGLTEGHWCVQLTIEDGGPNDADGEVNQAIDDPGGVARRTSFDVSADNDSGGGSVGWTLTLLALMAGYRYRYRRRQQEWSKR